jgi:hypothetical protein
MAHGAETGHRKETDVITTERLVEALVLVANGPGYFENKKLMEELVKESRKNDDLRPPCVSHDNRTYALDEVEKVVDREMGLRGWFDGEGYKGCARDHLHQIFEKLRNPTPRCPHCGQDIKKEGS